MEGYRGELSLRMKAIEAMLSAGLSNWRGADDFPNLATELREQVWAHLSKMPEYWQVRTPTKVIRIQDTIPG